MMFFNKKYKKIMIFWIFLYFFGIFVTFFFSEKWPKSSNKHAGVFWQKNTNFAKNSRKSFFVSHFLQNGHFWTKSCYLALQKNAHTELFYKKLSNFDIFVQNSVQPKSWFWTQKISATAQPVLFRPLFLVFFGICKNACS